MIEVKYYGCPEVDGMGESGVFSLLQEIFNN